MASVIARRPAAARARPRGGVARGLALAWLIGTLFVLVALPLAFVALQAVFPGVGQGSFAQPFAAVRVTLARADTWPLLANTLRFGVSVAAASVVLGVPLGALRGLTRLPFARLWDLLFLAPFLIPPYLGALGWMLLLQRNGYLAQLAGFDLGGFLFSFTGVTFAMTLSVFPVVYFSVSRALMASGGRLAQVARVCGATPWRAFVRITLPLAAPAIAASALLAFTMAIEEFGIPSALGARAGFSLLVTSIEARFSDWPIDLPGASVLSALLAVTALIAFFAQRRLLAGRDFDTQTGKPVASEPFEPGRWRIALVLLFGAVAFCTTIAPIATIVATAFVGTLSGGLHASNFTLAHFSAIASDGDGASALVTSLALAGGTAALTGVLGFVAAWVLVKTKLPGRAALDGLTLLPHAMPGIVVGVGLILAWNQPFWPVTPYNTWGILLLSYACLLLPYPVRYASAALRQLGGSLEAAARVHGASGARVLWRIVLPLVAPPLIASMMIVFAVASRELVTSLLLAPSGVQTASVFIWQQFEQGSIGDGMAMGTLMLVISAVLLAIATRLTKRFDTVR
ncbi:ABC transporter permease [Paraburkholderia acidisoli]|uniref:ABC transporter permease subunit n=1 Tax=Paraburkholderia acidisoli TaxID=2571748 RepID=A0A7Z2GP96_9BURK|nr:iron ABC transporter permease [Paraburkholderia acidisoli]QGZ65447.1 ABC transporter permease subunit [Paraburkholderia acidisoli]